MANGKKDHRSSQGTCVYGDRAVYKGQWHDDKRHGQGEFTSETWGVYIGNWENRATQGQGSAQMKN